MRSSHLTFQGCALALAIPLTALIAPGCGDDGSRSDGFTGAGSTSPAGTTTGEGMTEEEGSSSGTGEETGGEPLEIVGTWIETSEDGTTTHTITNETWVQSIQGNTFPYEIVGYDNLEKWVVARDDGTGGYRNTFSRFDWTWSAGVLYYCTVAFAKDTFEDARRGGSANGSDLENGCGGYAWLRLAPG